MVVFFTVIGSVIILQVLVSKTKRSKDKNSSDLHIARRIQHMVTGGFLIYISTTNLLSRTASIAALVSSTVWFYSMHLLRLRYPWLNEILVKHFQNIARPQEIAGGIPGSFFFLLASSISYVAFNLQIFQLALLVLSFGDPAAAIVGISMSSNLAGNKTTIGSIGAFFGSFASVFLFEILHMPHRGIDASLYTGIVMGVIGCFAERLNVFGLNDNLTIPLITGLSIYLLNPIFKFI